ncbi:hypothetical protein MBLNU459_g7839t1 [Dothideomycetes sp. NU459]
MDGFSRYTLPRNAAARRNVSTAPDTPIHASCDHSSPALRSNFRAQSVQRRSYSNGSGYRGGGARGSPFPVMSAYWLIFGVNAAVFGSWHYARMTNDRRLQQTLLSNTLASVAAWDSGRWWTVVTSAFAHHDLAHFAFNMFTLHTMCQIASIVPGLNGLHILTIALGSALAGSGGWLLQQKAKIAEAGKFQNWRNGAAAPMYASALGASGVVMGVSAVASCLLPRMPIQLMFIPIGIPLWVVTVGYGLVDSFYLDSPTSRTAHAGHLGGLAFGTVYYLARLRNSPFGVWQMLRAIMSRK